jgi:hypothetical protein
LTYGKQGTKKIGVKPEDHAIIYTGGHPPHELEGEKKLHKRAVQVIPKTPHKLDLASRVNYAKLYTIEHNVKVCFIGKIAPGSEATFNTDFTRTFGDG